MVQNGNFSPGQRNDSGREVEERVSLYQDNESLYRAQRNMSTELSPSSYHQPQQSAVYQQQRVPQLMNGSSQQQQYQNRSSHQQQKSLSHGNSSAGSAGYYSSGSDQSSGVLPTTVLPPLSQSRMSSNHPVSSYSNLSRFSAYPQQQQRPSPPFTISHNNSTFRSSTSSAYSSAASSAALSTPAKRSSPQQVQIDRIRANIAAYNKKSTGIQDSGISSALSNYNFHRPPSEWKSAPLTISPLATTSAYQNQQVHSQQQSPKKSLIDGVRRKSIVPVEYVNTLRRMSVPKLEQANKKFSQRVEKLKVQLNIQRDKIAIKAKTIKKSRNPMICYLAGAGVLLLSIFMFTVQDELLLKTMDTVMGELNEGGIATQSWQEVPIPINFCIYLMGLRNGEAFINGARPYIVEHGPFCYLTYKKKRVIQWKKHTVRYMERMSFKFDEKNSLSLDTPVDMINYPIFIAVGFAKNLLETFYVSFIGPIVYNGITLALRLSGEGLVDRTTARHLIEGKRIEILEYVDLFLQPIRAIGVPIPKYFGAGGLQLLNHSFGFTTTLASGEVGPFEVYRRTEQGHLVGDVFSFQERRSWPTWKAPCDLVKGGDGVFWRRPIEANRLTLFISVACRLINLVKHKTHTFKGAQVTRYLVDPQMFNMSLPRNQCFCYSKKYLRDCEGYHDISPCLGWLPVGFTFPHFYQSPNLLALVDGLHPDPEEHQGFLDMEPNIGAPVNARVGIQGVLDVGPLSLVPSLSDVPRLKLPIVYFKIHAGAEGPLAVLLCVGSNAIRYGAWAWLIGGVGFSGFLFLQGYKHRRVKISQIKM